MLKWIFPYGMAKELLAASVGHFMKVCSIGILCVDVWLSQNADRKKLFNIIDCDEN